MSSSGVCDRGSEHAASHAFCNPEQIDWRHISGPFNSDSNLDLIVAFPHTKGSLGAVVPVPMRRWSAANQNPTPIVLRKHAAEPKSVSAKI